MTFLIAGIVSIVLGALSFIPYWSWLAFPGFALGMAAWIWGVQMRRGYPPPAHRKLTVWLGIAGAAIGFLGIFIAFVLVSLLYGGLMAF